jgi:branched-chain amino acid transport system permease protein
MMTLVGGGLVSFWGPFIGVIVFLVARDVIGAFTNAWMLWFGLLFMAIVLFKPEGIAGAWRSLVHERGAKMWKSVAGERLRLLFRSG